jgi:ankyrin repeat protein
VTPIARAIISHNSEELNRLIKEGADVNQRLQGRERERAGFTPLILASALSDVPATQMLIERGAKITILDDYRRSALWYAALNENVPLLAALSKAPGAKEVVNTPDDDLKRTPLHIAVNGDAKDAVQILLILGASESEKIKDVFGETPLDICKDRPTTVCAALR